MGYLPETVLIAPWSGPLGAEGVPHIASDAGIVTWEAIRLSRVT